MTTRMDRFMPNGIPKYVRCYDNGGETFDRYTVVFTGRYRNRKAGEWFQYVGMSEHPFHPQGFGQHGENPTQIDYPTYKHIGKKIRFESLPEDCRRLVISDYKQIWNL